MGAVYSELSVSNAVGVAPDRAAEMWIVFQPCFFAVEAHEDVFHAAFAIRHPKASESGTEGVDVGSDPRWVSERDGHLL